MKFTDKLDSMNACSEAVKWVGKRGIKTAWRDCPRGGWMLWLAGKLDIDRKLLVLAACDCAETALKYVPEGEDRPAKAIQTSRNWCNGTATTQECRADAATSAATYAATSATLAATYATFAATYATLAATSAATYAAAYAATYATYATLAATSAADARQSARKTCADLVRKRIPIDLITKALIRR